MADQDRRNLIISQMTDSLGWHAPTVEDGLGGAPGTPVSLKYSFLTSYPSDSGFMTLGAGARTAVDNALKLWQTYAGLTFTEITNPADLNKADIQVRYYNDPTDTKYGVSFEAIRGQATY
ncbi:hypothetical protein [Trichlorobacter sp.]|uniref:hypothetical protein n=1 Tax=Trichlorobacter sp. TaxID=2911007 RepID=UPI002A35E671|nr:hypothetical protein [Trichlorobacter sp.]MDY0384575.1 hypothetical protein [Trichlorobacter sp.]